MKNPEATYLNPQPDLEEAKIRFLQAAEDVSPLRPVREHPFISLGTAFFAGMGFFSMFRHTAPTIATIGEVAGAAAKIAPLLISRARSSGG